MTASPTPSQAPNSHHILGRYRGLIGAVLLEANDEWQLQHRYMQVEAMAELLNPMIEIERDISPQDAAPNPSRAA